MHVAVLSSLYRTLYSVNTLRDSHILGNSKFLTATRRMQYKKHHKHAPQQDANKTAVKAHNSFCVYMGISVVRSERIHCKGIKQQSYMWFMLSVCQRRIKKFCSRWLEAKIPQSRITFGLS